MAGTGRAPKDPQQRRNKTAPQRGEWTELRPVESPKPPPLPARGKGRGKWSARTERAWRAWWSDPASSQWGPADIDLLEHLADVFEEWVREPRSAMASEIRQVRDSLGLTPKGKQDRRWRVVVADVVDMPERKSAAERMEELRTRAAGAGQAP